MRIGSSFCILVVLVFILSVHETHSLRKVDRQLFLDLHNWYRARFTRDTYGDQPVAADMSAMDWDEYLAWKAKDIARRCMEPKQELSFISKEYSNDIGVVSFSKPSEDNQSINNFLKRTFNKWIRSSIALKNDCDRSSVVCDNIKQILYSKTDKIGCGKSFCQNTNSYKLVCLYNVRLNKSLPIFQHGEACSLCQENQPFCLDGSFCASKTQCGKRNINSHCRCSIGHQSCEPNGIFKSKECRCSCKFGYYGLTCQDQCKDVHENCSQMQSFCSLNSTLRDYMLRNCRLTCGFCNIRNPDPIQPDSKRNLVINTVVDPMISEFAIEENSRCKKFISLCYMNYVQKYCPYTCDNYLKDMTEKVYESVGDIMVQDSMECGDSNPNCPDWKDQNLCHIENIQQQCLQSCQMCANSGNSILCYESSQKKSACLRVKNLNLCKAPDMQKICPITCTNTICHKKILESAISFQRSASSDKQILQNNSNLLNSDGISLTPDSTKIFVSKTEPLRCLSMRDFCSNSWIARLCKKTCSSTITKWSTVRSSMSPTFDSRKSTSQRFSYYVKQKFPLVEPRYCLSMKRFCNSVSFSNVCKITCGSLKTLLLTTSASSASTISSLSKLSTTKGSEPMLCPTMQNFCTNPAVFNLCKITCASIISKKTSTIIPSVSSTFSYLKSSTYNSNKDNVELPLCSTMKDLCTTSAVSNLCKRTCVSSTTSKLSTRSYSISSTTVFAKPIIESKFCRSMRQFCYNPSVAMLCKRTCGSSEILTLSSSGRYSSSTTTATKSFFRLTTDPSYCQYMKKFCRTLSVASVCKRTCVLSTSKPSTKTFTTYSTTELMKPITEPAICSSMTKACYSPSVSKLCKQTCAHYKGLRRYTSTSHSLSNSSSMKLFSRLNNEPKYCLLMKALCNTSAIATICKITCAFSTTSTLPIINSSISYNYGFSELYTTKAEPIFCQQMKQLCNTREVAIRCSRTCAFANDSIISSTTKDITPITEPVFCSSMFRLCYNPSVSKLCWRTCAYLKRFEVSAKMTPRSSSVSSAQLFSPIKEPSYCKLMKGLCQTSSVARQCKRTCSHSKTSEIMKSSSTTSFRALPTKLSIKLSTEPGYCKYMKKLCNTPSVSAICKMTCKSSTIAKISTTSSPIYSRTTSTILIKEPALCQSMKHLCFNPYVSNLCKMACASPTVFILNSTRFTKASTFIIKEKSMCQDIKLICTNPTIARICKKTCAYSAATKYFTRKSEVETSRFSILPSPLGEPSSCQALKELCNNRTIYIMCKKTCEYLPITISPTRSSPITLTNGLSRSSSSFSWDPSLCQNMKHLCRNSVVGTMCRKTCSKYFVKSTSDPPLTSSSISSASGLLVSSTALNEDPSHCKQMKGACRNSLVRKMCKKTCDSPPLAKSSTTPFSTLANSGSTKLFTKLFEPPDCKKMKDICSNPAVAKICIKTCAPSITYKTNGSSTSSAKDFSTTAKSTLSVSTPSFHLNNEFVRPFKKSTIEPPLCPTLKDLCLNPSVANTCRKTCGSSSTSKSRFSISTTRQSPKSSKGFQNNTDSSIGFQSSTTRSSRSLRSTTSEPTICQSLRVLCKSPKVSDICKITCTTI